METLSLSADGYELADIVPQGSERFLLGITGAPGAGKSTLAVALARVFGATVVPLDGFHLADAELARRGLLDRKGAPETFDAWGYAALLARLRKRPEHDVMAPRFDRDLEQAIAGSIAVRPEASLVLAEGNYLLLADAPWSAVRQQLDEVWHVVTDEELRRARLVQRHIEFGKSPYSAEAWVERVDQPNALLIEAHRRQADLVLDLRKWRGVV